MEGRFRQKLFEERNNNKNRFFQKFRSHKDLRHLKKMEYYDFFYITIPPLIRI